MIYIMLLDGPKVKPRLTFGPYDFAEVHLKNNEVILGRSDKTGRTIPSHRLTISNPPSGARPLALKYNRHMYTRWSVFAQETDEVFLTDEYDSKLA